MSDMFSADSNSDQNESFVEKLVGEGKKYSDIEKLAKSVLDKEDFIETLKGEKQHVQNELTRLTTEIEVLKKTQVTPSSGQSDKTPNGLPDSASVENLVKNALDKIVSSRKQEENQKEVATKVRSVFGDNFKQVMREKAEELGVDTQYLSEIAAKSPTALYKLINLDGQESKVVTGSVVQGTKNPPNPTPSGQRVWADYMKMMKENPDLYRSREIQQEIIRRRKAGELVIGR